MAAPRRKQKTSLEDTLFNESYHFEFHQAVKVLELMYPKAKPLGETFHPEKEVVSIKSRILLSYPSSDIFSLSQNKDSLTPTVMQVNFMGLAGMGGPLPMPHTEKIIRRLQNKDTAIQEFLNIFNHRLISILHRVRKKYTIGLMTTAPEKTALARILFSSMGLGHQSLKNRFNFRDNTLLSLAGLFWTQQRSAEGLRVLLENYFEVPVMVQQLQGRWQDINETDQTTLGINGKNNILGLSATAGTHFWDQESRLIIKIGPLNQKKFLEFLRGGTLYDPLCQLIRFYLGIQNSYEINLVIKASDVMASRLDRKTSLAWTSWLKEAQFTHDDDQVILNPELLPSVDN